VLVCAGTSGGRILSELTDAVRARRVSSYQLVGRSLERIARLDGTLNAVVALRAELALGEGRALDERSLRGRTRARWRASRSW
jgi:Asp-tRNA(Asn)/Glu-tRNA(Gln) amidotransferase A subunit family amidase